MANYVLSLGGEQITGLNGVGQWLHSNQNAGSLVMGNTWQRDRLHGAPVQW